MVTVVVGGVAALLLYVASIYIVFNIVVDFILQLPATADEGKRLAVRLLKVLDTLLIAVTFQMVAVGLFRLFIRPETGTECGLMSALEVRSFRDLKIAILQLAIVILVILFLEQIVEAGASLETLYMGGAIALVIASSVFAFRAMASEN